MQAVYDRLIDALKVRGGDVPLVKCDEAYGLFRELFTEEEAGLAGLMPLAPFTAAELSAKFPVKDVGQLVKVLEGMCDHGLCVAFDLPGGRYYTLPPLLPGFMEYFFMRGGKDGRTKRISVLLDKYLEVAMKSREKSGDTSWSFAPFRVISVEKEIDSGYQVQPYDMLARYIDQADCIALSTCFCHHFEEMKGNHCCDKPKEVCFNFGRVGRNNISRGFAREITKEEAHRIMKQSEEVGLVHCASNTGKYIDAICNCSGCHCHGLKYMNKRVASKMITISSFIASINSDDCIACGDCVARCQVDAITMGPDTAVLNKERCIGCGLCKSTCPSAAITLELRSPAPVPPTTRVQLNDVLAKHR
jgi:formate hydrogenlyase subunit 6/NADH:ubiquinone oxidoreductase subunit I